MDLLHPGTVWERNLRSLLIGAITAVAGAGTAFAGPFYIVGGNAETGHPAAGALIYDNEQSCTGTLIAPRVVLTAAHCLADFNSSQGHSFYIGNDANDLSSGTVIEITELIPHAEFTNDGNSHDIGLVRLAEDAPINALGFNSQEMDDSFIGQNPLFVGYGVTSGQAEDSGLKRSVNVPITSFEADGFRYAQPNTGTCFGDSGGPALLEVDGSLKVIGVTSWGDQDCAEFGVNTRTDLYRDFIECVVANGEDCGGRVIDGSGSNENGPGGGNDGVPDDWCTDGDGYCDEPCDTPDTDCGPDGGLGGGNDSELGPDDGYCIPDDGFCDDWCTPVDPDCDDSNTEQNGDSEEDASASDSDSSTDSDAENDGSTGPSDDTSETDQETGATPSGSLEEATGEAGLGAGGCSQASPDAALWLLLMGAWACVRRIRPPVKAKV